MGSKETNQKSTSDSPVKVRFGGVYLVTANDGYAYFLEGFLARQNGLSGAGGSSDKLLYDGGGISNGLNVGAQFSVENSAFLDGFSVMLGNRLSTSHDFLPHSGFDRMARDYDFGARVYEGESGEEKDVRWPTIYERQNMGINTLSVGAMKTLYDAGGLAITGTCSGEMLLRDGTFSSDVHNWWHSKAPFDALRGPPIAYNPQDFDTHLQFNIDATVTARYEKELGKNLSLSGEVFAGGVVGSASQAVTTGATVGFGKGHMASFEAPKTMPETISMRYVSPDALVQANKGDWNVSATFQYHRVYKNPGFAATYENLPISEITNVPYFKEIEPGQFTLHIPDDEVFKPDTQHNHHVFGLELGADWQIAKNLALGLGLNVLTNTAGTPQKQAMNNLHQNDILYTDSPFGHVLQNGVERVPNSPHIGLDAYGSVTISLTIGGGNGNKDKQTPGR